MPHLLTPDLAPRRPFGDLTVGTMVEEAKVLKADKERGVHFKLGEKLKGLAYVSIYRPKH